MRVPLHSSRDSRLKYAESLPSHPAYILALTSHLDLGRGAKARVQLYYRSVSDSMVCKIRLSLGPELDFGYAFTARSASPELSTQLSPITTFRIA